MTVSTSLVEHWAAEVDPKNAEREPDPEALPLGEVGLCPLPNRPGILRSAFTPATDDPGSDD